ncbi:MAG: type II CAAX endopeptidase family protein [candidate division Zixibacteria bacterium]
MEDINPNIPEYPESDPERNSKESAFPYRTSIGTYIVLIFLLIIFPGLNILIALLFDNEMNLDLFDPVWFFFVPTMAMLWMIALAVLLAVWREKAPLSSIGLGRFKLSYLGYALVFIIASNIILAVVQIFLEMIGIEFSNNIEEILKKAQEYIWWWLGVSITAAICEEVSFRGYVMSRIKGLTGWGWTVPVLISSMAFATGHLYQGLGGFLVILVYGTMFAILYALTRSIWPGILAHFIQDFFAVFLFEHF